jgi:beta-1,2-mannobiose phosphorylase / 1,2-beta-oligomannan phosphorylase
MAALLNADTGRVQASLPEPILQPELAWEREGDVANVVFVQGAVPIDDDTIYLTYGAADRGVGAAAVSTSALLGPLRAAA